VNHALSGDASGDMEQHLASVAAKSGFSIAYLRHRLKICQLIRAAIPQIADRFPRRTVIIRPHPSENREAWAKAGQGRSNVVVQYDDELAAWLMAAGHIMHNGCTTAVEAALLGRAAISYRPIINDPHEIPQPHRVSHEARTLPDLMNLLARPQITDTPPQHFEKHLSEMIAGRDGQLSSTRAVMEFRKLLEAGGASSGAVTRNLAKVQAALRHAEKKLLRHVPGSSSQMSYVSQKFPAMSAGDVHQRLQPFVQALNLEMPVVRELSDRVFNLRRA
jgi:hypothetical protein